MLQLEGAQRNLRPFVTGPFEERGAIFSPNGRWVAYVSNKSGENEVFARPYPGPGAEVPVSIGGGEEPVWAGEEIFYRHGGKLQVARVEIAGASLRVGRPTELFEDGFVRDRGGAQGGMANYDVSPDGRHFVMVEEHRRDADTTSRLQVVLNWLEDVKHRAPVDAP
jgi:Tol biopolymer transport system component